VGDPRLGEPRRWGVFWIHHEAEELRVHHRTSISVADARAVVVSLLASGRVPPLQATLFDIESLAGRPVLHRFWGTACRCGAVVYLILFINERCLVLTISG
jgi:hypothetical protein